MVRTTLTLLAALFALALGASDDAESRFTIDPAITAEEFLENIQYLASDELEGRIAGSRGLILAAEAVRDTFKAAGLKPMGDDYFQALDVQTGSVFGKENLVAINRGGELKTLTIGEHYVPVSTGRENAGDTDVVFVGYGISAPELEYDDYEGVDVEGKILLMLDYEPLRNDKESPFDGAADTQYAQHQNKILTARGQGAAGVIIVPGPVGTSEDEQSISETGPGFIVNPMGIPAVRVSYHAFKPALEMMGLDLVKIQQDIDAELKPLSQSVDGVQATLNIDVDPKMQTVFNVVGYVEGSDPELKDQYIIVGAHYDHLGPGYFGTMAPGRVGEVHNGADDNASGTSGLMEVAEAIGMAETKPKRSVMFIAFAAEEMGLLGSAYYVNNPLTPAENMVAMLNMDMIGRVRDKNLTVGGVGTAELFQGLIDAAMAEYDLNLALQQGGFASSDNASFTAAKIPALFFFSGTHGEYHTPDDDWQLINAEDGAQTARLVAHLTKDIANAEARPEFVEGSATMERGNRRAGNRPWFGSMPDFGYQGDGYKFGAVTPGSPAAEAGLQGGDIMIEFEGEYVGNIYDFTSALGRYKPGDVVVIKVKRGEEIIEAEVKLTRRK